MDGTAPLCVSSPDRRASLRNEQETQASSVSTGRTRLPPAATLYSIDSPSWGGQSSDKVTYVRNLSSTRLRSRVRTAGSGSLRVGETLGIWPYEGEGAIGQSVVGAKA